MSWAPVGRLVLVEWIDSNSAHGWHQADDMLATVKGSLLCKSVGWLLLDGHDRIALVPNLAETGSVGDALTIPKLAVVSMTELPLPT